MELEALRIFVKVAELGSFTRAAQQLGTTKSRVSLTVQALEAELGTRLLQRTTRTLRVTPDGEQCVARAKRVCGEADALKVMFQAPSSLRGRLRVDMPVAVARRLVIPRLPEFLASHPALEILISSSDRRVEVVREGFDCVLSIGHLRASGLVARRVGALTMVNCASPSYIRKHGVPSALSDLDRHYLVHYSPSLSAGGASFEYRAGDVYREYPMRSLVTVNSTDAYTAACLAGLGIIQAPSWGAAPRIERGHLVEVLPELASEPMPVSLVHSHGRNVPRRVCVFMAWLRQLLEAHLTRGEHGRYPTHLTASGAQGGGADPSAREQSARAPTKSPRAEPGFR
jgi:DNA-binding transcriptional LysR family regulator